MNEELKDLVEEMQEFLHKGEKLVAKAQQKMGMRDGGYMGQRRGGYQRMGQMDGYNRNGQHMGQMGGVYWGQQNPMMGGNQMDEGYFDPRYM